MDAELKTASEILDELIKHAITAHAFTLYLRTSQDVIGREDQTLYFNVNHSVCETTFPTTTSQQETQEQQEQKSQKEEKDEESETIEEKTKKSGPSQSNEETEPESEDFDCEKFIHDLSEVAATHNVKVHVCDPEDFLSLTPTFPKSIVLHDVEEERYGATVEDVYDEITATRQCLTTSISVVFEFEYLHNFLRVTMRYSLE